MYVDLKYIYNLCKSYIRMYNISSVVYIMSFENASDPDEVETLLSLLSDQPTEKRINAGPPLVHCVRFLSTNFDYQNLETQLGDMRRTRISFYMTLENTHSEWTDFSRNRHVADIRVPGENSVGVVIRLLTNFLLYMEGCMGHRIDNAGLQFRRPGIHATPYWHVDGYDSDRTRRGRTVVVNLTDISRSTEFRADVPRGGACTRDSGAKTVTSCPAKIGGGTYFEAQACHRSPQERRDSESNSVRGACLTTHV